MTVNGSGETESAARWVKARRFSWITARREVIQVATQITSKHGFTDNLWLQMAALAIMTLVVIALAAEYVW